MADVFISYSRKDQEFVRDLIEALQERDKNVWVNWEDIHCVAGWRGEVSSGIDISDTFLFASTLRRRVRDKTARVWEERVEREVSHTPHEDSVAREAFGPSGEYPVTGSSDRTAQVWICRSQEMMGVACSRSTRNLTQERGELYLADEPYRKTCPNLPVLAG